MMVNEWLCSECGLVYGRSDQMTLQEANEQYGVNPDAIEWYDTELCLRCGKRLKLVPRYTNYEFAALCGQLSLFEQGSEQGVAPIVLDG